MPIPILAIAALAAAGYQIYQGEKAKKEAKNLAKTPRPEFNPEVPKGEYDALNLLQSRAGQGMSDASKNLYKQNADRGLSSTIDAIIKGGGDINSIGKAQQGYLDGLSRLSLADDAMRLQNINNFLTQQRRISDMQRQDFTSQFQVNEYAPFADKMAAAAQLRTQGQQMTNAGINTAGNAIGSHAQYQQQRQGIADVNGGKANFWGDISYPNASATSSTAAPSTYGAFGASTSYNSPDWYQATSGYDMSSLSPSQRMELMQLLNNQSSSQYPIA